MVLVFGDFPNTGDLDYVTCWYRKAAEYITSSASGRVGVPPADSRVPRESSDTIGATFAKGTPNDARGVPQDAEHGRRDAHPTRDAPFAIPASLGDSRADAPRIAFVSTNSITQGEQVPVLWSLLFQRFHLKIHFAHRTFAWASEARGKAHVHVVIIGLGAFDVPRKFITDYEADSTHPVVTECANISPYLAPGSDSFITKHRQPLCEVPEMRCGNKPTDDGNFILTDAERADFVKVEPGAEKFLRRFTGSEEFINGNMRWCLWLKDAAPGELRKLPKVMERVEKVREFRAKSTAKPTQQAAARPTQFFYISQPATDYILIPEVSSERRAYIPMGFVSREIISANTNFLIPSSDVFLLGVLTSAMHMAWVRTVGGRLKSDYRYSGSMVYNSFPWPNPTPVQRARVEEKARAVLAAREPHLPPRGMATLADLYDPNTMPRDLLRAHTELDRAVEKCYHAEAFHSDRERVEHLFSLYEKLTAPLLPATQRTRGRRST